MLKWTFLGLVTLKGSKLERRLTLIICSHYKLRFNDWAHNWRSILMPNLLWATKVQAMFWFRPSHFKLSQETKNYYLLRPTLRMPKKLRYHPAKYIRRRIWLCFRGSGQNKLTNVSSFKFSRKLQVPRSSLASYFIDHKKITSSSVWLTSWANKLVRWGLCRVKKQWTWTILTGCWPIRGSREVTRLKNLRSCSLWTN